MEIIIRADRVKNEKAFTQSQRVKDKILRTLRRRRINWIVHTSSRNCLLKRIIEGKIEGRIAVTGRRGRRCK